ncbi:hypothetical protein PaG_00092 [Moesziomyces aphidis]|uniref:Uncharacterized protein n=1 Tax=Moesziomyces aphidis TaxID=84754 RepID=W3VUZ6_MOEAP|nr:hypothetical protein PaG_00092 [Moesziomyces aphidis]
MVPAPTRTGSGVTKPTKSAKAKRAGHSTNDNGNAGREDPATLRLRSLASSLPSELITYILEFAASTATENTSKLHLLCLSRYYHDRLAPLIYATVALCSSATIHAFAGLVNSDTKVARHVRRLWVGPDSSSSDLITALSPPSYNEAAYITDMREHVHASVRIVLRSCRKLQDVALAGELLSLHAAHKYGSACQPVRLTSVNPHSFVGGFSAPIFRKVRVLRIVDTNLAFEEADEIRTLADLEWLIWSAPKDYGDITRDSNVLRRLLQRPSKHFAEPQLPSDSDALTTPAEEASATAGLTSTAPPAARAPAAIEGLWNELSALELNEGLAPARPSKNDKFRRLTIQTAHNRCDRFRTLLADSFPLYQTPASSAADSSTACLPSARDETGGLAGGLDATFEDLEREWDPVLNIPTIHPTSLSGVVLDEWDALRDLINNAGGQYSGMSIWDQGDAEVTVDAGNALRRQRTVWEQISDIGLPSTTRSLKG